ncbi:MAG: triose-phosphate isomerase [Clostridia bacterium]|nr:triose-phosphate isomerase [Clostridia bacterium]
MNRTPFIAGNWKMNNTPAQARALISELLPLVSNTATKVAFCVPFVCIPAAAEMLKGTNVLLGAQNLHFEEKGAFTGEISAPMLVDCGVGCVIIGHSERRQYFNETDETVNLKAKKALEYGLLPIVCVGESLDEREKNETDKIVSNQIHAAFNGLSAEQAVKVTIAYEPIWAIGTGRTATAEEANRVCGLIRAEIAAIYDLETAEKIIIQYGGSMNAQNCDELMAQPEIDGGLIGGASLKAGDFARIVNFK